MPSEPDTTGSRGQFLLCPFLPDNTPEEPECIWPLTGIDYYSVILYCRRIDFKFLTIAMSMSNSSGEQSKNGL